MILQKSVSQLLNNYDIRAPLTKGKKMVEKSGDAEVKSTVHAGLWGEMGRKQVSKVKHGEGDKGSMTPDLSVN